MPQSFIPHVQTVPSDFKAMDSRAPPHKAMTPADETVTAASARLTLAQPVTSPETSAQVGPAWGRGRASCAMASCAEMAATRTRGKAISQRPIRMGYLHQAAHGGF